MIPALSMRSITNVTHVRKTVYLRAKTVLMRRINVTTASAKHQRYQTLCTRVDAKRKVRHDIVGGSAVNDRRKKAQH